MNDDKFSRINEYRCMWVIVFFDLPTETKKERRVASQFRKKLLNDGFTMFQFSIYMRFCASRENSQVHTRRIKSQLPEHGHVCFLTITDKQFGMMESYYGHKEVDKEKPGTQLTLF